MDLKIILGIVGVLLVVSVVFNLMQTQECAAEQIPCPEPEQTECPSCEQPIVASDLELRVPNPPVVAEPDGQPTLVYELYMANYTALGLELAGVEVIDGNGAVLKTLSGDELKNSFLPPEYNFLCCGTQVVFMWVELDAGKPIPQKISHRVQFMEDVNELSFDGAESEVIAEPIVISPPLRGDNWFAADASNNGDYDNLNHRRTILSAQGRGYISQRYATDWLKFGPDGRLYKTDGKTNEDYYCYGEKIYAVADGTVVDVKDGIALNTPGSKPKPTFSHALGNSVVVDIGNGHYAFYAHMIPGSITVKTGDEVKAGDVLGLLGNTGNSDAPHLHFHICRTLDVIFSEGDPFLVKNYTVQDRIPDVFGFWFSNGTWNGTSELKGYAMAMPANGDVVDFGD